MKREINTFLVSAKMPNMKETMPSAPTTIAIFVAVTAMLPKMTNYGMLNPCNIQRENYYGDESDGETDYKIMIIAAWCTYLGSVV